MDGCVISPGAGLINGRLMTVMADSATANCGVVPAAISQAVRHFLLITGENRIVYAIGLQFKAADSTLVL